MAEIIPGHSFDLKINFGEPVEEQGALSTKFTKILKDQGYSIWDGKGDESYSPDELRYEYRGNQGESASTMKADLEEALRSFEGARIVSIKE